ncbi:hypothetical protein LCGC14_2997360, partial [marine sediment metagenome]
MNIFYNGSDHITFLPTSSSGTTGSMSIDVWNFNDVVSGIVTIELVSSCVSGHDPEFPDWCEIGPDIIAFDNVQLSSYKVDDTKAYDGFEYEYYATETRNDVMVIPAITANVIDSSEVVEIVLDSISVYDKFANGNFTFEVDGHATDGNDISPNLDVYVVYSDGTEERATSTIPLDMIPDYSIPFGLWGDYQNLYFISRPDEIIKEVYVVYTLQADHNEGTVWLADPRIEYTSQAINTGGNPRYQIDLPVESSDFLEIGDLLIPVDMRGFNPEGTTITVTGFND